MRISNRVRNVFHRPSETDEMMRQTYDTIIIGGGIAGLTAALRLKEQGLSVKLVEASGRVGGVLRTMHRDGFLAESGPNSILETHEEVTRLIDDIGLADERIYASDTARNRFVVRNNTLVALPMSLGSFVSTPLFSSSAKLRLLAEPFIRRVDPRTEESVADFVRRRIGQEFLDYAIDPFVSGVYAGRPENLSVKYAFPGLVRIEERYGSLIAGQILGARERRRRAEKTKRTARMFTFVDGLARLPEAIASKLGSIVRTGLTIGRIEYRSGVWQVADLDEKEAWTARSVIFAAGIRDPNLLRDLVPDFESLAAVKYPPLSVVSLGFRREDVAHALNGFGVLVPSVENRSILGALFSSTLFRGRAPEGCVLITTFVGGARQPELARREDADIRRLVLKDLTALLGVSSAPVFEHLVRWRASIPQYEVGYGRVHAAIDAAEKAHEGLYFTGNYRDGISVPDTIKHATETAARVSKMLLRSAAMEPATAQTSALAADRATAPAGTPAPDPAAKPAAGVPLP